MTTNSVYKLFLKKKGTNIFSLSIVITVAIIPVLLCLALTVSAVEPSNVRTGKQVFQDRCMYCHSTSVSFKIWGFPKALVKTKVRIGIGAMPRFPISDISDEELNNLTDHIKNYSILKPSPQE